MGSLGALRYNQNGSDTVGISGVNDIIPTAFEQYDNGLSPALSGEANIGFTGFDYSIEAMDGVKVGVGYSPSNDSTRVDDGTTSGDGGDESGKSIDVDINLIDGLRVVLATGEEGDTLNNTIDQDMYGAVYTYGPVSVGYQNTDRTPDSNSAVANTDRTQYSVARYSTSLHVSLVPFLVWPSSSKRPHCDNGHDDAHGSAGDDCNDYDV